VAAPSLRNDRSPAGTFFGISHILVHPAKFSIARSRVTAAMRILRSWPRVSLMWKEPGRGEKEQIERGPDGEVARRSRVTS